MRIPTECDDCGNRTATCHATCEIHRQAWCARRERNSEALKKREATDYTTEMIQKTKGKKTLSNFKNFRPKERR